VVCISLTSFAREICWFMLNLKNCYS